MDKCGFWDEGTCAVIAELTGCDKADCKVQEDACTACLACERPQTLNRVTASIGLHVAKTHCDAQRFAEVRSKLSPAIAVDKGKPAPASGPGTELKKLLSRLGIRERADCGCKSHAREMDHRGVDWCRENIDTIVGWLREEAGKQGLPFVDAGARMLVKYAIRRAS